ncbi:MAG: TetR/AcrR family transcriptional regulator [Elusimicrobiaceae bacterium]
MSRPAGDSLEKLISAGKELAVERGFSGLRIREVARRAQVNPGMFHYHFKTKQEFTRRVMRDIYGEFLAAFLPSTEGRGSSVERLEGAILVLALFAYENRRILKAVLTGLLEKPGESFGYLRENFSAHAPVLISLIKEAQQDGYIRQDIPFQQILVMMMGGIIFPGVMSTVVENCGAKTFFGMPGAEFKERMFSEEGVRNRIKIMFASLAPEGRHL